MSETGRSGINRAFSWLKKSLQITEKTVAPDALSAVVVPSMDVFGWERIAEAQSQNLNGGLGSGTLPASLVPPDTIRVVLAASIETTDPLALNLWFEQRVALGGGLDISLMLPFFAGAGTNGIRVGLPRAPVLLAPSDTIVGRSLPVPAAGTRLILRWRFIDLPIGEYILGT